jgi:integrase
VLQRGGPDGKFNWYFTQRVAAHFEKPGITRERVTFHSLRKNVTMALERARVMQSEVALIIGHERGFTFGTYNPMGLDLSALGTSWRRSGIRERASRISTASSRHSEDST